MNKKQAFRLTAFLLVVACILVILCDLFEYPNSHMSERFKTYSDFDKGTVDAIYIGTSGTDRFWIPGKAFDEYGMTVYPLSIEALPSWNIINILQYGMKKQKPSLVIIDTRSFLWNPELSADTAGKRARRVADQFDFLSFTRFDAINRSLKLIHSLDSSVSRFDVSYYLPFIRYHDMWSDDDFTFDEIGSQPSKTLGYRLAKSRSLTVTPINDPVFSDATTELDKYNKEYLYELIEYIKDKNINALFVSSPRQIDKENVYINNAIFNILEEEGMNCINFSTQENVEKYKFDYSKDFYDEGHVNFYGAVKYTEYFSEYLNAHYNLPDHRDDEKCESWHGNFEYIQNCVEKWENSK